MAKGIWIELPYNYSEADIEEWLYSLCLEHLKTHNNYYIKAGDALKCKVYGTIVRVMETKRNEVGEPFIFVSNKKATDKQVLRMFYHEYDDGCPVCGDYEGDAQDCPNGCHHKSNTTEP